MGLYHPPLENLLLVNCPTSRPYPNHRQAHHPRAWLLNSGLMDTLGCVLLYCTFCALSDVQQHIWPLPPSLPVMTPKCLQIFVVIPWEWESPQGKTKDLKPGSNSLLLSETLSVFPMSSQWILRKESVLMRLGNYVSYVWFPFSGGFGLHYTWAEVQGVQGKRGLRGKAERAADRFILGLTSGASWLRLPCLKTVRQGGVDTQGSRARWLDRTPAPVQFSHTVISDSLPPHGLQHTRPPCPSPTPRACSNSCPLSRWCQPTISSSVVPFSSCLQSFLASGSFPMSQLFSWGGQSIGASASVSVPPMNTQDWFPLGSTGLISLQSKGLSRIFSNTTAQKHQFFSAQLSLWSNSHIHTWLLEKP